MSLSLHSGAALAQEVERVTNRKVSDLICGSSNLHVKVALGRTLNPKLLLKALQLLYEWVNVTCRVKCFEFSED